MLWGELQAQLAAGHVFYCHKGVPFKAEFGELVVAGKMSFDFPRVTKAIDIAGECRPYEDYDTSRMRYCRGYLNAHVAPLMREMLGYEESEKSAAAGAVEEESADAHAAVADADPVPPA